MSVAEATAIAHPNIALAKYWGKRQDGENLPAVPSLSVTLAGLLTTTTVTFDPSLASDTLELGGAPAEPAAVRRVCALLNRVRAASGRTEHARVVSRNDFPTAAGLASSASGFAALALAATTAAGLDWERSQVSDLARRSSVSAARSLFGGFVELPAGRAGDVALRAAPIAPPDHWDLRVIVAVTREGPKEVGSSDGMRHTAQTSPFYPAWVQAAPSLFVRIRDAVLLRDFEALAVAAEESALRMHATSIAASPSLLYWTAATITVLEEVRRLRGRGIAAFATIDAGPHVKVITTPEHESRVTSAVAQVPGVIRTISARPGPDAALRG